MTLRVSDALAARIASVWLQSEMLLSEEARQAFNKAYHDHPGEATAAAGVYYVAGYNDALRDFEAIIKKHDVNHLPTVSRVVPSSHQEPDKKGSETGEPTPQTQARAASQ